MSVRLKITIYIFICVVIPVSVLAGCSAMASTDTGEGQASAAQEAQEAAVPTVASVSATATATATETAAVPVPEPATANMAQEAPAGTSVTAAASGAKTVKATENKAVLPPVKVMDIRQSSNNPTCIDNINILYEGKPVSALTVYMRAARYYLPLKEMLACMNGAYAANGSICMISLDGSNYTIDAVNGIVKKDSKDLALCKQLIYIDGGYYMSLFDFTKAFGLLSDWKTKSSTISLYKLRNSVIPGDLLGRNKSSQGLPAAQAGTADSKPAQDNPVQVKPALVRLEDITAFGGKYAYEYELAYYRVIADYLYSESIPFSVAWVPRFLKPKEGIDNDPVKDYNMYNMDFIYTMDYFIDRGGIIGLHGYTHQYGSTNSIAGVEFGQGINDSDAATRERFNMAIASAKALEIPIGFFEFPHYAATKQQYKIAEEYFSCIYQHPYKVYGGRVVRHESNGRTVTYIPTPLDYVQSKDKIQTMLNRINSLGGSSLASFFFHPHIDYDFIKVTRDESGCPTYSYSEDSCLHRIIDAIEKKGYVFVKPCDVD